MRHFDQPQAPLRASQTLGNRPFVGSGTALAIIDTPKSAGSIPAKGTWGGARNSASRTSQNLTLSQCQELIDAADHAERLGLPFNRHWTVHYEKAGIPEADAVRFVGRLLKLLGDFARGRNAPKASIWVREGGPSKGGHVHILLHLPARVSLKGRTRRWVRLAGGVCVAGVSFVRSVAGNLITAENGGEHYAHNLRVVREYLLKGASREACEALSLERGPIDQGLIVGKRCGTTQNIGQGERQKGAT